jgi:hypothetical protein
MVRHFTLPEVQDQMRWAQDRLSRERLAITRMLPLDDGFDKKIYGEAYRFAEHLLLRKIKHHLGDLAWLPVRLDPDAELRLYPEIFLKEWVLHGPSSQPSSFDFGNDFVHAVARAGITFGWNDIRTARLTLRIAHLFCNLSYLVSIVFFASYLPDLAISELDLSDPMDLALTTKELADLIKKRAPKIIVPASDQVFSKPDAKHNRHPHLHLVSDESPPQDAR